MPKSPKRVAIYARVSTDDKGQDPENQLRELRAWCEHGGHEIYREYVDYASGSKGATERREFANLFNEASRRRFDLVLFWSLDRFSREGMTETVIRLKRLDSYGVAFHSYTEEYLSTDNELVRDILLATLASLARAENVKISERTKAGLERARAEGKKLGRPTIPEKLRKEVEHLLEHSDLALRAIARKVGAPYSTVADVKKKYTNGLH